MTIKVHTFETRLVKMANDQFLFMDLSKDSNGNLFYISHKPVSCSAHSLESIVKLQQRLYLATTLPIVDTKDIKEIIDSPLIEHPIDGEPEWI
jgi:hypothetical protein